MKSIFGRDFTGVMECEHCKNKEQLKTGYNDANYHDNVIPKFYCKSCGKNRAGLREGEEPLPEMIPLVLFHEYLLTLDDKTRDEWFMPHRSLVELEFDKFYDWLRVKFQEERNDEQ